MTIEIVDFPMKEGDFPQRTFSHYQRVTPIRSHEKPPFSYSFPMEKIPFRGESSSVGQPIALQGGPGGLDHELSPKQGQFACLLVLRTCHGHPRKVTEATKVR